MTRFPARLPELPAPPLWMRRPRLLERATPVVIAATVTAGVATAPSSAHPVGALLALSVSAAGVLLGHRRPVAGLGLLAAGPLVAGFVGVDPIVMWQVSMFGAFLLCLRGLSGISCAVVIGAADFLAMGVAAGTFGFDDPIAWIAGTTAIAAAVAGSAVRGQQQYWAALQERTHEAIAGRDAAVQRSVAEERLRIAHDLHDTLGHEIAVMGMHLGAAEVNLPATAAAAREHLLAARGSVKSLLAETQEILEVLHTGSGGAPPGPVASHHDIPDLVDKVRAAGMDVDACIGDLSRELPPQTSAAAYRITQEALTNAQRYGRGQVRLTIQATGSAVTVEAVNDVASPAPDVDRVGQGLIGMRERAAAAGGRLEVSTDSGVFRLRAALPVIEEVLR
ncbi:Integral membrane sensor signal transduction histidine kinase [Modestobacter italicus]|uniref:histidine kinase n=1 Tax=Modestobacter italicus (strain DSM 44449 / CECT 9708 / BC 501) TaxID=2732864 RepID=I4F1S7_MODI5|nr:histidine kinase [Modestobacter marinus]CCH89590.1 Integral membrane sensor signal transduction histidine kinase [Modestobacter marinus]